MKSQTGILVRKIKKKIEKLGTNFRKVAKGKR